MPIPPLGLYPAIDLKGGACVRLRQGAMEDATLYTTAPADQARAFAASGCDRLHVVDLDGAVAGRSINQEAVRAILSATGLPVQLGGGVRSLDAVDAWLTAGVARVILGSVAVSDPALVAEACRLFPGRIAVGIDARDGRVATQGWAQTTTLSALDVARRVEDAGVAAIIFTDIGRDGMLTGVNIAATADLASRVAVPVIASGGVGSVGDLHAIRDAAAGLSSGRIEGVIVGRAFYDGRMTVADALAALGQ
jgi:phosphoribosylformimino-5-aminoimidazole carboxamide ribotide isomerase